jgi:hypothetical protein
VLGLFDAFEGWLENTKEESNMLQKDGVREFAVEIEGVEPGLLQHRFSGATVKGLLDVVKSSSRQKHTPEEEAKMVAYLTVDGTLVQPGEHIFQAMVKASSEYIMRGKRTYKDAVKGNVYILPELIPHRSNEYEIDARRVVIQKASIVRHRPLLREWGLSFTVRVMDDTIPDEVIHQILQKAGQSYGIGDFRPRFGKFAVTKFEKL